MDVRHGHGQGKQWEMHPNINVITKPNPLLKWNVQRCQLSSVETKIASQVIVQKYAVSHAFFTVIVMLFRQHRHHHDDGQGQNWGACGVWVWRGRILVRSLNSFLLHLFFSLSWFSCPFFFGLSKSYLDVRAKLWPKHLVCMPTPLNEGYNAIRLGSTSPSTNAPT